jgi:hypothetical protein
MVHFWRAAGGAEQLLWQQFLWRLFDRRHAAGDAGRLPGDARLGGRRGLVRRAAAVFWSAWRWLSGVTDVKAHFEAIRLAAERVTEQIVP